MAQTSLMLFLSKHVNHMKQCRKGKADTANLTCANFTLSCNPYIRKNEVLFHVAIDIVVTVLILILDSLGS